MTFDVIPTFREVHDQIGSVLREHGGLGAVLVDLGAPRPHRAQLRRRRLPEPALADRSRPRRRCRPRSARTTSSPATSATATASCSSSGSAGRRPHGFVADDLRRLATAWRSSCTPRVARLTLPYMRERPIIDVGYGFVLWSPLENEERQILRLIEDARDVGRPAPPAARARPAGAAARDHRQPAASGPPSSPSWRWRRARSWATRASPAARAAADSSTRCASSARAGRFGLVDELERVCRRQVFVDWEIFGAPARLFVNTVPATVRDASFLGRGVLDYLGPRLSPSLRHPRDHRARRSSRT